MTADGPGSATASAERHQLGRRGCWT